MLAVLNYLYFWSVCPLVLQSIILPVSQIHVTITNTKDNESYKEKMVYSIYFAHGGSFSP